MTTTPVRPTTVTFTGRDPGTPDYERVRVLLGRGFGTEASSLLRRYRDRELDVALDEVETPEGSARRLILTSPWASFSAAD